MLFWWPTSIPWLLQFEIHFTGLDMSSLTKIRYLQIEPSEKKTHVNESIMFKYFIHTDSLDKQSAFGGLDKIVICSFLKLKNF